MTKPKEIPLETWRAMPFRERREAILERMTPSQWVTDLEGEDIMRGLRAVVRLKRVLETYEEQFVRRARAEGASWDAIARGMEVSRQRVHKRWAARVDGRGARASGAPGGARAGR